jgi:methylphosphotriester-DNA--protein-cysteine methyltransferase
MNRDMSDAFYAAMLKRDPAADGVFFVGVRTTFIYCPGCSRSTEARPELGGIEVAWRR